MVSSVSCWTMAGFTADETPVRTSATGWPTRPRGRRAWLRWPAAPRVGVQSGPWFEPEMVNADSDLARSPGVVAQPAGEGMSCCYGIRRCSTLPIQAPSLSSATRSSPSFASCTSTSPQGITTGTSSNRWIAAPSPPAATWRRWHRRCRICGQGTQRRSRSPWTDRARGPAARGQGAEVSSSLTPGGAVDRRTRSSGSTSSSLEETSRPWTIATRARASEEAMRSTGWRTVVSGGSV